MGKYGDWTRDEEEALLNIIGGTDIARAVLRGERKLTVGEIANSPLVGTVVKTLRLQPYKMASTKNAIKLGKYNYYDDGIPQLFASDEVGLTEVVSVDLVKFDRNWHYAEVLVWAQVNGNKKPILPKHLFGIGIQHPEEQRNAPIVELGSVQRGYALYLFGDSDWRILRRVTVESGWPRGVLVGFLSE